MAMGALVSLLGSASLVKSTLVIIWLPLVVCLLVILPLVILPLVIWSLVILPLVILPLVIGSLIVGSLVVVPLVVIALVVGPTSVVAFPTWGPLALVWLWPLNFELVNEGINVGICFFL